MPPPRGRGPLPPIISQRAVGPAGPGYGRNASPGLAGDVGGITSYGHLTSLLDLRYLSASYGIPPLAKDGRGTRTVAIIPQNVEVAVVNLVAGSATFKFPIPFTVLPIVQFTPVGAPSSGTPQLYISNLSLTSVEVSSTSGTDARAVHVVAFDPSAFTTLAP